MEISSFSSGPDWGSLQAFIQDYNQQTLSGKRAECLKKISDFVQQILKDAEALQVSRQRIENKTVKRCCLQMDPYDTPKQKIKTLLKAIENQPYENFLFDQILKVYEIMKKTLDDIMSETLKNFEKMDLVKTDMLTSPEKLTLSMLAVTSLPLLSQSLEELTLYQCEDLKDQEFQKLLFLNLKKLRLVDAHQLRTLNFSTTLKVLELVTCGKPEDQEYQKLGTLNLETLHIDGAPHLETLNLPTTLTVLKLSDCPILIDQEFQKLRSYSRLEELDASKTRLKTLDKLPPNLKELNLMNTHLTTLKNLPLHLIKLDLTHCCDIESDEFQELTSLQKLEILLVENTQIATTENFSKNLTSLSTLGCKNLKKQGTREKMNSSREKRKRE